MLTLVEVIVPKVADGSTLEVPQPVAGLPNSTWLGALNISMRNWSVCFSAMRKSLSVEKSKFTCVGPTRLLRAQVPNSGTTVLVNAAGLNHPREFGLGNTGSIPETQLSRLLTENPVPGESHEPVSSAWPLCAVAITLSCHPPANWFTTPPRFNIGCPVPNGNVYKVLATNRCGTL